MIRVVIDQTAEDEIDNAHAVRIRVVAFPSGSRKPGYWENRLPKN